MRADVAAEIRKRVSHVGVMEHYSKLIIWILFEPERWPLPRYEDLNASTALDVNLSHSSK